jgi:hypothetical protein
VVVASIRQGFIITLAMVPPCGPPRSAVLSSSTSLFLRHRTEVNDLDNVYVYDIDNLRMSLAFDVAMAEAEQQRLCTHEADAFET